MKSLKSLNLNYNPIKEKIEQEAISTQLEEFQWKSEQEIDVSNIPFLQMSELKKLHLERTYLNSQPLDLIEQWTGSKIQKLCQLTLFRTATVVSDQCWCFFPSI